MNSRSTTRLRAICEIERSLRSIICGAAGDRVNSPVFFPPCKIARKMASLCCICVCVCVFVPSQGASNGSVSRFFTAIDDQRLLLSSRTVYTKLYRYFSHRRTVRFGVLCPNGSQPSTTAITVHDRSSEIKFCIQSSFFLSRGQQS